MSFFDHARCPHCRAMLDPESIGGVQGRGMRCPRCNNPLQLTDLFGVADAFSEEDGPSLSLDHAVPGYGEGGPDAPAPEARAQKAQSGKKQIERGGSSAADVLKQMRKKR